MAYDEELDQRVADIVGLWGAVRRKMFGGTGYLINGNMLAGVHRNRLILRLGAADADAALQDSAVSPFDMTRKPMAGWVQVDPPGFAGEKLEEWLLKARTFVSSLPPK
ncbi:MAG: TfoX/Sxy family protein [Actinobacteria bacterium]|nr:TfoX/Sxy family protein [Actinomycetota bacterium]